jgi:FkbM family methyltransferase
MTGSRRKLAFVLAASDQGAMIVSRLDYRITSPTGGIGVGYQILESGAFDASEVSMVLSVLELRRRYFKDGVLAIDCGANIGVHTIEWAKRMTGWGSVLAIEAQERIYYALAGNIALNNCFNAVALNAAVADQPGILRIPQPDYLVSSSFGSLELRKRHNTEYIGTEYIGQPIDYSDGRLINVQAIAIDSLKLSRIDFIKLDVEGMEMEALAGGAASIAQCRPVLLIESIKTDAEALREWLAARDYLIFPAGLNLLAVHRSDPIMPHVVPAKSAAQT